MRTAPLLALALLVAPAVAQVPASGGPPGAPAGSSSAASAAPAPSPPPEAPPPVAAPAPPVVLSGPADVVVPEPRERWDRAPRRSRPPAPRDPAGPDPTYPAGSHDAGGQPTVPLDQQPLGTFQDHTQLSLAYRMTLVRSAGFDPFSQNDALDQTSVAATHTVMVAGRWSVAGVLGWDAGGSQSEARGQATHLYLHRLTGGAEARYHLFHFLHGYARLDVGALYTAVDLEEATTRATLESSAWTVTGEGLVGIAGQVLGVPDSASRRARGWVFADAGYTWSPAVEVALAAPDGEGPERLAQLDLGEYALRGLTFRFGAAVSF